VRLAVWNTTVNRRFMSAECVIEAIAMSASMTTESVRLAKISNKADMELSETEDHHLENKTALFAIRKAWADSE
jgi:hypothetical protein